MKKRDKEYKEFLSDVYNRVDARPLLFEQHNEVFIMLLLLCLFTLSRPLFLRRKFG